MKSRSKQQGLAVIVFLALLTAAAAGMAAKAIKNNGNNQIERDKITAYALAQAKEALIGYAVTYSDANPHVPAYMNGYLPLPDLGPGISIEGSAAGSFSGNVRDYSAIGKVPWKTLDILASHDGQGECIWYVVSGRFKNTPTTNTPLNWDTLGQIDVIDGNGNAIASNIAALVVSPGRILDGQTRTLVDTIHPQCGGNYDAQNYLDSYNSADAISGQVNYFVGSTNNRIAPNTNNKSFVIANNGHYNDRFLFITPDEIFRPIIKRSDFRDQITALLNDTYFKTATIAGTKGTGISGVNCEAVNPVNRIFCTNWQEMLLLTQLSPAATITIDGATTSTTCSRVLIFGGKKTAIQARITSTDKAAPSNYLEGANLTAFTTHSSSFNGNSSFVASNPSADLLKCIAP